MTQERLTEIKKIIDQGEEFDTLSLSTGSELINEIEQLQKEIVRYENKAFLESIFCTCDQSNRIS